MGIGDTGISPSYKVPRYVAKIIFAAGAVSAGSQRLRCLLVGMKGATGSLTPDGPPVRCTSEDEADVLCAAGTQLARMAYAALQIPGLELWLAAVAEPAGGTAATITIVVAGAWTVGGVLRFRVAGIPILVNVGPTDTIDVVGANIAAAFSQRTRLPCTAAYEAASDTVTLTIKTKGAFGRDYILYHDPTDKPAGLTLTITGSATVNTNGYRFGAGATGAGSEDVTTLLTKLTKTRYARIGVGQNDATNAQLWEAHVNTKGGQLSLLLEHLVFGHNGTKAQAKTLAQTNLNAFRGQVCWLRNAENHPSEIAALVAAIRSVTEQTNPVPDYDGLLLEYLKGQEFEDDIPSDAEQDEVLNAGVTPLTTVDGQVRIVRGICTYCMSAGVQDERCLDIGDPVMTDYGTLDLKLLYETDFRPQNPIAGPDPAPEEAEPAAGVAFPKMWTAKATERMFEWKANGWTVFEPRGKWAPVSVYNSAGGFIASEAPIPVARVQHRLDMVTRQISTVG